MGAPEKKKLTIGARFARLPRLPFELILAASAPFVLHDFSKQIREYPNWAGPLSWLSAITIIAYFLGIGFIAAIALSRWFSKTSVEELQRRAARAQELENIIAENVNLMFDGMLLSLSKTLNLKPSDLVRLTVYVPSDGTLVRAGRFATNPTQKDAGRKIIPVGEGIVSEAWQKGFAYVGDLGTGEKYIENCEKRGIPADIAKQLSMKSRMIAALRINLSFEQEPIGVMVFESMKERHFGKQDIEEKLGRMTALFETSIPTLRVHIPRPDIALERGL
jgi:hypothetical protein